MVMEISSVENELYSGCHNTYTTIEDSRRDSSNVYTSNRKKGSPHLQQVISEVDDSAIEGTRTLWTTLKQSKIIGFKIAVIAGIILASLLILLIVSLAVSLAAVNNFLKSVNPESTFSKVRDVSSCSTLHKSFPSLPSGYYFIKNTKGAYVQVYCAMDVVCGQEGGGWMRVIAVNFTSLGACPKPWKKYGDSCAGSACQSKITIPVLGVAYHRACGRVVGKANGKPNAFRPRKNSSLHPLNFDGIGITRGSEHHLIWAYVAGYPPCSTSNASAPPPEVGENYYCEELEDGNLWDSKECHNDVCQSPLWFNTPLSNSSNDIHAIICSNQPEENEKIAIKYIELYIQ